MKTIILHGSPRRDGNSDTLVTHFLTGLTSRDNKEIEHFYLNELDIKPCQGCLTCATSPNHTCAIKDDMENIYSAYINADLIVFATPMYWGYMTAQLKIVLDRMEALAWEQFKNKIFVVIITYRHHFESTVAFFKRIAPFFNIKLYTLTCCTFDKNTQKDIPIAECTKALGQANKLGLKLSTI